MPDPGSVQIPVEEPLGARHTLRVHSPTELLTVSMVVTFDDKLEIWMGFVGLSMVSIYVLT